MKTTIKTTLEVEITTLEVRAGVRYWEDATVNGVDDVEGKLIPFRDGDYWCPVIDIDTGIIKDWPSGTTASIHYKVCDDGRYWLKNDDDACILSIEDDYVPDILFPKESGYGDYIILDVDENGHIDGWRADLSDFGVDEDAD